MTTGNAASPFRYRGLWQWNPVSCVGPRSYDERHMARHDAWFHDRALVRRYFGAMREAGLNTWVLANTHPFPFMVDLREFPDARVLGDAELRRRQDHSHWLFETAREHGVMPFVLFHTCYVPDAFGRKHDVSPGHGYEPPEIAVEYTRACVRLLCETYPELEGVNGEASENVAMDVRSEFARRAVVAGIHDSGRRPVLFFRGWISDPASMKRNVLDAYEGECFFTVKYTWEFLIEAKPDPEFLRWVDTCGADRIVPEFWISNYQPFGCHDTELARDIREEIGRLGCPGFTSHPMDLYGAPFVQGAPDVLQLDRDRDWYGTLSGAWEDGAAERASRFGIEDAALLRDAATAASRPSAQISYYMTGNKQNFLQPQLLAAVGATPERRAGLQTVERWAQLPEQTRDSYGRWMKQIDGIDVCFPGEVGGEFGLADLIARLDQTLGLWREPPDDAASDGKAYSAWLRDIKAQRMMALAWAERARAVLAWFAGETASAIPHLERAIQLAREVPDLLRYDGPYRLLVGRHTIIIRWSELIGALQRELADFKAGGPSGAYGFGEALFQDTQGRDFATRDAD